MSMKSANWLCHAMTQLAQRDVEAANLGLPLPSMELRAVIAAVEEAEAEAETRPHVAKAAPAALVLKGVVAYDPQTKLHRCTICRAIWTNEATTRCDHAA